LNSSAPDLPRHYTLFRGPFALLSPGLWSALAVLGLCPWHSRDEARLALFPPCYRRDSPLRSNDPSLGLSLSRGFLFPNFLHPYPNLASMASAYFLLFFIPVPLLSFPKRIPVSTSPLLYGGAAPLFCRVLVMREIWMTLFLSSSSQTKKLIPPSSASSSLQSRIVPVERFLFCPLNPILPPNPLFLLPLLNGYLPGILLPTGMNT